MPNVTYHPKAGDPKHTTWRGFEFEAGKSTDIPDTPANKETLERAANNAFFEVSGAKDHGSAKKPQEKPAI